MTARPPEAREVVDEDTIIVHRTHDLDEARALAKPLRWLPDEDLPDWIAHGGMRVWVRTTPAPPGGDMAFYYRSAWEGQRGAFRAVVFTTEPARQHWWIAS